MTPDSSQEFLIFGIVAVVLTVTAAWFWSLVLSAFALGGIALLYLFVLMIKGAFASPFKPFQDDEPPRPDAK